KDASKRLEVIPPVKITNDIIKNCFVDFDRVNPKLKNFIIKKNEKKILKTPNMTYKYTYILSAEFANAGVK
ncbi:hypothetical protein OFN22_29585, partial [Escherichia coli]|nr:hypothetical protein [Escherichia coli]